MVTIRMVRAFVMVRADDGSAAELADAVRDVDAIIEAHVVAGDWDLIAELDAPDVYGVLSTVSAELRELRNVADTRTYVSLG